MKNIEDVNILIIGDIMLDEYISCNVDRLSPEASVPVCVVLNTYDTLGGCGNVLSNIRSIGASCDCIAEIGNDEHGQIISELINEKSYGLITSLYTGTKPTTVKTRIISEKFGSQLLRIDRENRLETESSKIIPLIKKSIDTVRYDMIVASDYDKGVITKKVMNYIRTLDIPIIVDPKPRSYIYDNVFMITPNEKEYNEFEVIPHNLQYVLKTKGKKGMELIHTSDSHVDYINSKEVNVYNVSGAGDTVIAVLSVCISMGIDVLTSCKIANECARCVVSQPGTSIISKEDFSFIQTDYQ